MLPWILGGGVLALGWLFCKSDRPQATVGAFEAPVMPSGKVRVKVRIPIEQQNQITHRTPQGVTSEAHLTKTVKDAFRSPAVARVLLVAHDPTDLEVWSFLVESQGGKAPPMDVTSIERVEEPEFDARIFHHEMLDEGMTVDEATALLHALRSDENPKHLGGMAHVYEDEYPIAASLLRAKARLSTLRGAARRKHGPMADMGGLMAALSSLGAPTDIYDDARKSLYGYRMPFEPKKVEAGSIDRLKGMQTSELVEHLHRALSTFTKDPKTLALSDEEVSTNLGVSPVAIKAAREMVTLLPGMIAFVEPAKRKQVGPLVRKPMTMAALQLAHAMRRPVLSGVTRPGGLRTRFSQIGQGKKAGDKDARDAQAAIDRAEKALSRRQWIEWHKRVARVPKDAPPPGSLTGVFLREANT